MPRLPAVAALVATGLVAACPRAPAPATPDAGAPPARSSDVVVSAPALDLGTTLRGPAFAALGFRRLSDVYGGDEEGASSFPVEAFASATLPSADALAAWRSVRGALGSDVAVVMVATDAPVLDDTWEENVAAVERALALLTRTPQPSLEAIGDGPSAVAAVRAARTKSFADPAVRAVIGEAGVAMSPPPRAPSNERDDLLGDLHRALSPPPPRPVSGGLYLAPRTVPHRGESILEVAEPLASKSARVFVVRGDPALAPLYLRWGFTPERAASVGALLRSWRARFGFEVISLSAGTLHAYVAKRPATLDELAAVVDEQLVLAPDVAQEDDAVVAVLFNALGHRWSLWWD